MKFSCDLGIQRIEPGFHALYVLVEGYVSVKVVQIPFLLNKVICQSYNVARG